MAALKTGIYGSVTRPHQLVILVAIQVAILFSLSANATIIPEALAGRQAWRLTIVALIGLTGLVWLNFPVRISRSTWVRIMTYSLIIGGPYVLFLVVEFVNAMTSGNAVLVTRVVWIRLFTLLAASGTLFLAAGGGRDVRKGLRALLIAYVLLALYISITGTLAWVVLNFDFVNSFDWSAPSWLSDKLNRKGGGNLYSMPFMLGLALVGANDSAPLGTFRISGLSVEPNSAALFVTPALFALSLVLNTGRRKLMAAYGIILMFLFLTFSVANVLSMGAVAGIMLARFALKGNHWFKLSHFVGFLIVLALVALVAKETGILSGRAEFIRFKSGASVSAESTGDVHKSMLEANSFLGRGIFDDPGEAISLDIEMSLLSVTAFWLQAILLLAAGLLLYFSNKPTHALGLALVYVVMHSMKDPGHILWWPMYMFAIMITILGWVATSEIRTGTVTSEQASQPVENPQGAAQ